MMKIILNGAAGRMGKESEKLIANDPELELTAKIDKFGGEGYLESITDYTGDADMIVDFSHHSAAGELCAYAVKRGLPLMIATTGQTDEEIEIIKAAAKEIPVFHSANMSLGVALTASLAKKAAEGMPDADIEIVETHHNRKLDAPSGTAKMLAEAIKEVRTKAKSVFARSGKREKDEIGITSVRRGNIVGIHEILISTDNETITIKHEAHSRALFADGAVAAAKFLCGKSAGLYTMNDMVK